MSYLPTMTDVIAKPERLAIFQPVVNRLTLGLEIDLRRFSQAPSEKSLKTLQSDLFQTLSVPSVRIAEDAYRLGCRDVLFPQSKSTLITVHRLALQSARLAANQICHTNAETLNLPFDWHAAVSTKYIDSKARAATISRFQMLVNLYHGFRWGWKMDANSAKRWYVSSAHDKDDICDENEDAGAIDIDDAFPSGDYETPAHINCECQMILVRRRARL